MTDPGKHFPPCRPITFSPLYGLILFLLSTASAAEDWKAAAGGGGTGSASDTTGTTYYADVKNDPLNMRWIGEVTSFASERRSPVSKATVSRSPRSHFLSSIEFDSKWLYVSAGSRFIPGPSSLFLSNSKTPQGVQVPPSRSIQSAFAQVLPEYYAPGVFALSGSKKPGFYFREPGNRFFLAFHPDSGLGCFSSKLILERLRFLADIERVPFFTDGKSIPRSNLPQENSRNPFESRLTAKTNPLTVGGTTLLNYAASDTVPWYGMSEGAGIEAERRTYWDLDSKGEIISERKGKSGLIAGIWKNNFAMLESAGQDIGNDSMRLVGGGLRYVAKERGFGPVIRARAYERKTYGASDSEKIRDQSLGGGIALKFNRMETELIYDSRKIGPQSGEISIFFNGSDFGAGLTAFAQSASAKYKQTFYFMRTVPEYSNGATFFRSEQSALQFRVRAKFLNLYLSHKSGNSKSTYGSLEARIEL